MVDIRHRVGIKTSVDNLYTALATRDGLASWWTTSTHGDSRVGSTLRFRFSADGREIGGFDMKVLELEPGRQVRWEVIEGRPEWPERRQDRELALTSAAGWRRGGVLRWYREAG